MASKDEEDDTERHMRALLEHEGFQVVRVPSSDGKTADYRVSDENDKYLIEVKRKEDDPVRLETFDRDFHETGKAIRTEPSGHTNTMSGIIRDAAKQLECTASVPGEFKIIWFAARGQSPDLQMDQFRSTLYGEVRVLIARPGTAIREVPCFYYNFNEFYKLPHIDGAIACSETCGGFYLNPFSPRASALKETKLFKMYEASRAVCDPSAMEAGGNALVFDQPTDRRDKAAILRFFWQKYGLGPTEILPFPADVSLAKFGMTIPLS